MPRIQTAAVRSQVLQAALADELRVAAGNNTLISRTEQAALSADLHEAAEIARSRNPGRAPTVSEIQAVLAERLDAGIASVNQATGSGRAFLSKAEVTALVSRDPLLGGRVQRAVDVLAGALVPPPGPRLTAADVKAQLDVHTPSLTFDGLLGSEGGEPISAVLVSTRIGSPPTADELARALGHDPSTDAGFVERFKAADAALLDELQQSNGDTDAAKQTIALLRGLSNLRLLIVGKDGAPGVDAVHPTYIVGNASDGQVVGIKTGVVWT